MTTNGARTTLLGLLERLLPQRFRAGTAIVPVVRLTGVIGFTTPLRPGLTLSSVARSLERAFSVRRARAVALAINSPGGSAVQAHLIHQRIRQLAKDKKLPVLAFIEDVGASGGYMIACAGDEIICDPSSIVGSIGVIGATFGFQMLLEKIGVERRVYTAGEHKSMLDPFLPENPDDVRRLKAIQSNIHERFIALVKASRGAKLTGPESALFSGEYWSGEKALELGLVDRLGDLRATLRERFGEKVMTPLISERSFFGRPTPGVASWRRDTVYPSLGEDIVSAIETRALWARYGL
ncbi:MAG: S49 family peptidase [Rhizobiales bacterium]|nr:S49 family peptidase [Hyphomicrobiales bacterium]